MISSLTRRHFLQLTTAALIVPRTMAVEPIPRTGPPRLRLSLAAYSFRDFFGTPKLPLQDGERALDFPQFIDFCAEHGCEGAELTSYYFPKDVRPEQLRAVADHARLRKVAVSGTSVGNTFTHPKGAARDAEIAMVKRWVDHAVTLGAPHVRVFAGSAGKGQPAAEAKRLCIEALEECCAYAGERQIRLGIENHGGIVAGPDALLEIVRAVQSPWCGVNLDTGNFHTADPYADLARIAPNAVNVQLKSELHPAGAKSSEPADLPRLVKILRDANYQGWVALEYEAAESPWKAVPPLLAKLRELLGTLPEQAAKEPGWVPLFDGKTLGKWKPTEFGGRGDVTVEKGAIVLESGNDLTGVNFTGETPKTNYEVQFEAMKLVGDDFFCGFTFPVAETHCTLILGGWGGGLIGLSSIDGNDASENETMQTMKFEKDRWYQVRLRVTPAKIEAWIDAEQIVDLELAGKKISLRSGEIEQSAPFGIASYRTRSALRGLRLRAL